MPPTDDKWYKIVRGEESEREVREIDELVTDTQLNPRPSPSNP